MSLPYVAASLWPSRCLLPPSAAAGHISHRGVLCWSLHLFLRRPACLLSYGMYHTVTWECVYRSFLIHDVGTILSKSKGKLHPCTGTEALYKQYGP